MSNLLWKEKSLQTGCCIQVNADCDAINIHFLEPGDNRNSEYYCSAILLLPEFLTFLVTV